MVAWWLFGGPFEVPSQLLVRYSMLVESLFEGCLHVVRLLFGCYLVAASGLFVVVC